MAIIFIISKPIQALFLHQIYKERGGQSNFGRIKILAKLLILLREHWIARTIIGL
jgi:hypothetical protein